MRYDHEARLINAIAHMLDEYGLSDVEALAVIRRVERVFEDRLAPQPPSPDVVQPIGRNPRRRR